MLRRASISSKRSLDVRSVTYRGGCDGFRIDGFCYYSKELPAGLEGKTFKVCPDPRDARRAHVFIGQRWFELRCRVLEQRWREMPTQHVCAVTQEWREARKNRSAFALAVEKHFEVIRLEVEAQMAADEQARQNSVAPKRSAAVAKEPALQLELDLQTARKRNFKGGKGGGDRLNAAPATSGLFGGDVGRTAA